MVSFIFSGYSSPLCIKTAYKMAGSCYGHTIFTTVIKRSVNCKQKGRFSRTMQTMCFYPGQRGWITSILWCEDLSFTVWQLLPCKDKNHYKGFWLNASYIHFQTSNSALKSDSLSASCSFHNAKNNDAGFLLLPAVMPCFSCCTGGTKTSQGKSPQQHADNLLHVHLCWLTVTAFRWCWREHQQSLQWLWNGIGLRIESFCTKVAHFWDQTWILNSKLLKNPTKVVN